MAVQSPAPSTYWQIRDRREGPPRRTDGPAERLASWLVVYLTALMTSLALGGSIWAFGLAG